MYMKIITLFFYTNSPKFGVYFAPIAYPDLDWPCFKYSISPCT